MIPLSHTMVLTFYLRNQIIKCAGIPEVVEDSKNYLYAQFIFSPDWAGQTKTAIFGHDNNYYEQLLGDDAICKIPYEVIKATSFTVSVVGGDRITANAVTVRVTPSGYQEGQTPEPPTPDIYEQIIEKMEQQAVDAQAALDAQHEAEKARDEAGESAEQTKEDRDAVASDKQSVENTVTNFSDVIFPNAVEIIDDKVTDFSDVVVPTAVQVIDDKTNNFSNVIFPNAVETIEDQVTNFSDVIFPNAVQDIEDTGDAQVLRVTQTGDAQVEAVEESGAEQTANAKEQAGAALLAKQASETARDEAKEYAESIYLWQKAPTLATMDFAIMLYPPLLASI